MERPEPLFIQLKDHILREIKNGSYRKGEKIPTEAELTKKYSTSITTVRKAIQDLCTEGILEKQQGRGTFVRDIKMKIGLVSPYPGDSWTSMWEGLQNASKKYSFLVKFYPYDWSSVEDFIEKLDACVEENDGLVVFAPYYQDKKVAEKLFELEINKYPVVFIEKPAHPALNMFNFIQMNYQQGFEDMISSLQKEYERIAIFADPAHASYSGLIKACDNCGIDQNYIRRKTPINKSSIPGMVDSLLEMEQIPEVIVCVTSIASTNVFGYLRSKNLNVPGDIALAGAGNINALSNLLLPMKALKFPRRKMGEEAGRLISKIFKSPDSEHVITLEPEVIEL